MVRDEIKIVVGGNRVKSLKNKYREHFEVWSICTVANSLICCFNFVQLWCGAAAEVLLVGLIHVKGMHSRLCYLAFLVLNAGNKGQPRYPKTFFTLGWNLKSSLSRDSSSYCHVQPFSPTQRRLRHLFLFHTFEHEDINFNRCIIFCHTLNLASTINGHLTRTLISTEMLYTKPQ